MRKLAVSEIQRVSGGNTINDFGSLVSTPVTSREVTFGATALSIGLVGGAILLAPSSTLLIFAGSSLPVVGLFAYDYYSTKPADQLVSTASINTTMA